MSDLVAARFLVTAEASPGLLSRLLQPLAKRDLTADAVHAVRQGEEVHAELVLDAMPAGMVHLVAGNLGQVFGVLSVETVLPAPLRAVA
ncbi:hypothetical protein [Paracraurococcus lichenis]|uniref:ACT domain-containing protein n=1 Tax=Paracraurococcus lichenis TaxID=3064888 RepID=A0ABT9E6M5_9PROT|nr:hypothetical protein [Paracraurococcus sp. LOR1-02]MDO9711829.1 hypothetical protein [Paracraurococcus sp. LOR1-02]